ncbi:hypothetical protein ABIE89_006943 [Bradyrhizobium niftali]|uniref:hypothetical protein n=1 Tax=Bradyrhizobium niftali TaxID=2560055 RepID=UPI00383749B3
MATTLTNSRTLSEARCIIDQKVAELRGELTGIDFVLAEDDRTVMIYCDVNNEHDALAIYFDLAAGETFDPERHAADFVSPSARFN